MDTIRLGISSCLLGNPVRYDGGHKLDRFLRDTLGRSVDFVPVCPEVECGLGVPRESMHLSQTDQGIRLITTRTGIDLTERMNAWAARKLTELEREDLCGFIFKSKSPSCGMERLPIFGPTGTPAKNGVGLFARPFMERFPLLPVEDEGRLNDPDIRENFIERIFTLRRWRTALATPKTAGAVVDFHTRNKLLIMAHSPKHYQAMGPLVAGIGHGDLPELTRAYQTLLMQALGLKATPAKHVNVLQHMLGYFKRQLAPEEKQAYLEILDRYRQGLLPLIVPITLMQHYVRTYRQPYLASQTYLNPHPLELQLRNHS